MINFESPLFIDILLYAIYAMIAVAIGLSAWSMLRSVLKQDKSDARSNGIPTRRIAIITAAVLLVSLVLTGLLASTRPLTINGKAFNDEFWLRISDMLINTSVILIIIAVIGAVIGYSGISRRIKK